MCQKLIVLSVEAETTITLSFIGKDPKNVIGPSCLPSIYVLLFWVSTQSIKPFASPATAIWCTKVREIIGYPTKLFHTCFKQGW